MSAIILDRPRRRYGLSEVVRAETIKIWSLRSTYWTLLVTLLGSFTVTVLATQSARHHPAPWYQGFDPTNVSMSGLAIGTLAIGVLGATAASGEYSSGTIRATLSAAPRRPLLLLAKVLVVGVIALAVGEILTFGCWGIGHVVLGTGGAPTSSLAQPAVLRAVVLSGVFLALLGLLGLALGVIMRHTAGAISTYVAVTFLIPLLLATFRSHPDRYTPVIMLANTVSAVVRQPNQVGVGKAMVLMAVYCAVALGLAAAMIVRRDA